MHKNKHHAVVFLLNSRSPNSGKYYILPVVVQVVEEGILRAFGSFSILFGVHNLHWIWMFILY